MQLPRLTSGPSTTALAGPVPLLSAVDMAGVVEEDDARVFVLSVLHCGDPIMIAGDKPEAAPAGESPQLTALLKEHADVFKLDFGLPPDRNTVHVIDLEPDAKPVYTRMYRLSPAERRAAADSVTDLLKCGLIEPSTSPWSSSIAMAAKADGSLQACVDYCRLNALTSAIRLLCGVRTICLICCMVHNISIA